MNIEEKKEKFRVLLNSYYVLRGEKIKIKAEILAQNDLLGTDFFEIVCPILKREGILKNFSELIAIDDNSFFDWEEGNATLKILDDERKQLELLNEYHGIRKKLLKAKRKNEEDKLQRFMDTCGSFYSFEVDGKKMEELNQTESKKIKINISKMDGIYREGEEGKKYPIKGEKRFKLLKSLEAGRKNGNFLIDYLKMTFQNLSGTIKDINKIFKKKLFLRDDLIVSAEKGGYKLNDEKYDIKFT